MPEHSYGLETKVRISTDLDGYVIDTVVTKKVAI